MLTEHIAPTASSARPKSNGIKAAWLAGVAAMALGALPPLLLSSGPAAALSELKQEEAPAPATPAPAAPAPAPATPEVPLPDPLEQPAAPEAETPPAEQPEEANPATPEAEQPGGMARPDVDPNAPLPTVEYDVEKLPEPVRRMRNLLVEASKTGDIEKLRALIGTGERSTQISLTDITEDPITYLKGLSGDPDGQELLAIMEEVLSAGYVHLNGGTPEELYVWPYFFGLPLDKLTPRQRVELFKIVTAGDYEDMKGYGSYLFYRLGITPSGEWAFFVAGE